MKSNQEKIMELANKLKRHEINWEQYQESLSKIMQEQNVLSIDKSNLQEKKNNFYTDYNPKNLLLHDDQEENKKGDVETNKEENKLVAKEEIKNEVVQNEVIQKEEVKKEEVVAIANNQENTIPQEINTSRNKYIQHTFELNKDSFDTKVHYFEDKTQLFINSGKTPILKIRNLTKKHYSKKIINNVSFDIFPGEFHLFLGPNGAGKTSTIKAIIGAYSKYKYKGTITINNKKNEDVNAKKIISYVPENAIFPKKMILKDYLYLVASLSNIEDSKIHTRVEHVINEFGLRSLRRKKPYNFSSGQKKRVLLAQGMISDPEILILDEPVANLDPTTRMEIFEYLAYLKNKGKTIFISSHIFEEISQHVTYCTIIDNGKIVYDNFYNRRVSLSDLYKKYTNASNTIVIETK